MTPTEARHLRRILECISGMRHVGGIEPTADWLLGVFPSQVDSNLGRIDGLGFWSRVWAQKDVREGNAGGPEPRHRLVRSEEEGRVVAGVDMAQPAGGGLDFP